MTVSTTITSYKTAGNGVTTSFSYNSKFFALDDLLVTLINADGSRTVKTRITDYNVTGTPVNGIYENGGNVVMLTPPPTGSYLLRELNLALTQSTDLITSDSFDPNVVEQMADREMLVSQIIQNQVTRSPKFAAGSTTTATFDEPTDRGVVYWDNTDLTFKTDESTIDTLSDAADEAEAAAAVATASAATSIAAAAAAVAAATSATGVPSATATGTDTITATFVPAIGLLDKQLAIIIAAGANATTTPTFAPNGAAARFITKKGGSALAAGDIPGAGASAILQYNAGGNRWELLNPATVADAGVSFTDVTTGNASSTAHGFQSKSPADATKFLNGAASPAYALVKDSDLSTSDITTNDVSTSKHGFAPKGDGSTTKFLNANGAYSTPTGGNFVYLGSVTASASASLAFTSLITSTYNAYKFIPRDIRPATNNTIFKMFWSTDNGSTYNSSNNTTTARRSIVVEGSTTTQVNQAQTADQSWFLSNTTGNGNGAAEGVCGEVTLFNPLGTTSGKKMEGKIFYLESGASYPLAINVDGAISQATTTAINAAKFQQSSGNLTSGVIDMYGIKNS